LALERTELVVLSSKRIRKMVEGEETMEQIMYFLFCIWSMDTKLEKLRRMKQWGRMQLYVAFFPVPTYIKGR